MSEIMVRYDDLRLYCEKRHCGSVPIEYIKQLRTVEGEPVRRGRWILDHHGVVVCNLCRHPQQIGAKDFCGKCGARMDADAGRLRTDKRSVKNMTTTADLIDICSLYFTQSAAKVGEHRIPFAFWPDYESFDKHILRCSMYALAARLILEGVY